MIKNAGLFSEPSLIIFTKGANNSDHDCIYIYIQMHLNKLECREKSSFFLVTYFKKWNFHIF